MDVKIPTSRIKVADLRFFDKEHNGVELSEPLSKGILIDPVGNGSYYNPFCLGESYPIFERGYVSNVSLSGEAYGTKVYHVSNELVTGPCWVITSVDFKSELHKDEASLSEIKEYVINSKEFYKDRAALIKGRTKGSKGRKWLKKFLADEESIKVMDEFFAARECGVQKTKKD